MAQSDKKLYPSCLISQEPYIIWCSFVVHMWKRIISPGGFFLHFFQIFIFGVNSGVKGQKVTQNNKKLCLLHSISQEAYIWSWFLMHMCKKMTSPDTFFIFSKFWFSGIADHSQKLQIISSRFLVHSCKIMISPGVFLYFFKKIQLCK